MYGFGMQRRRETMAPSLDSVRVRSGDRDHYYVISFSQCDADCRFGEQTQSSLHYRIEDWLCLSGGIADDLEDFGGGGLTVESLFQGTFQIG